LDSADIIDFAPVRKTFKQQFWCG